MAIGLAVQAALLAGDRFAAEAHAPFLKNGDVYARTLGWRALGEGANRLAAEAGAASLAGEDRATIAALLYYARDSGRRVYAWPQAGPRPENQYEMERPLVPDAAVPVLVITACNDITRFGTSFFSVLLAGSFDTPTGPTSHRTFYAFRPPRAPPHAGAARPLRVIPGVASQLPPWDARPISPTDPTIAEGAMPDVKKVVLAYSGGLDTSIILKWLQTELWRRGRDLHRRSRPGRGAGAGARARPRCWASSRDIFIEDLREEFVRDFVFPMFRANALYEGEYLLGTSIARPLIAKRQIEIARKSRRRRRRPRRHRQGQRPGPLRAVGYYALEPDIKVIAPWREWDFKSRAPT